VTHPQPPTAARSTVQLLAIGSASPVEELLRLFVKAARNYQLYPANNPILGASLEALRSGFAPVWEETDELVLAVSETELRWGDQVVHRDDSRGNDALPWTFYKDGIRELRLLPGVEGEEVVKLLDILQRGRVASPEDDDLLTLLWEAEFTLLRYRYVDLTFEGTTDVIDGTPGEPPEQVDVASMAHAESASGIVNVGDFDSTLYFLDEREIEYLQAEVRR